jgi:hypothetical protein
LGDIVNIVGVIGFWIVGEKQVCVVCRWDCFDSFGDKDNL